MEILDEIQKFENDFIAAGKMASDMRHGSSVEYKSNTGFYEMDIVTLADIAVQEFILEKLSKSQLLQKCQLLAEENTEFKDKFAETSELVLTIDPIDGTYLFVNGKKMWKVIVGIHDKKRPLYTFCYFPEYDFAVKMVGDECTYVGQRPHINLINPIPPKSIVYGVYGKAVGPEKLFPNQYPSLLKQGYSFIERKEISNESSTTGQFLILADKFAGLIMDGTMGSAVDILVGLHFGICNGYEVTNEMDLSKPVNNADGIGNYAGYFLVLKK
jgi:fructose-1,6-bisphosphatase/inositol monophosphatase family enzyme